MFKHLGQIQMVNLNVSNKWRRLPCSPPQICGREQGCPQCNVRRVRGRIASLLRTIDILESEVAWNYGLLTVTLPGKRHESQIRFASLSEQYDYFTRTVKFRVDKERYSTSMRGLTKRLEDFGVDGNICGLEITNGGGVGDNWNVHAHLLLISGTEITIPESKKEIDRESDTWEYIELGERNPWSIRNLASLGFGAQYQYTHIGSIEDALREVGKITYGVKVERKDGEANTDLVREMEHFFSSNPRLLRKTGVAIIPWEDKLRWATLYPDRPGADYVLNYEYDTKLIKHHENFMVKQGYEKVDKYGQIIGKRKDKNGFNRHQIEYKWRKIRSGSNESTELLDG